VQYSHRVWGTHEATQADENIFILGECILLRTKDCFTHSLMKICLNETYSKVCAGKHLPDSFPIQMV
jgi:hypothetical protein